MPAAAPQEANVSTRPRSRSNACTRGKYISALSLRNGQARSASNAVRGEIQLIGGSTINIACRSRENLAATSSVLQPTSCSRASGGMHKKLNVGTDFRANTPVQCTAEPMTS